MTAFAAIAGPDASDRCAIARITAVLTSVYGSQPVARKCGDCVLIAAPLPGLEDEAMVVHPPSGAVAAGQAMLEGRAALARRLDLAPAASALAVCAAALDRWGAAFTDRLSGEFAIVVWDPRRRSLFAARDGLGVRQLFAGDARGTTVISNTVGAVVAHPSVAPGLDAMAIAHFLAYGWLAPGRTAFRGVAEVAAAHTVQITGGRLLQLRRHWTFPEQQEMPDRDFRETVAGYRDVLEEAVRDRLPPGRGAILLSGGIDSTTIAAAACSAAASVDLRAFTADYAHVPAVSELPLARLCADALGIPITAVPGDEDPALHYLSAGALPPQPMNEPALSDWRRLVAAAAAHAPVALYGEDGDSLFLPPGWQAMQRAIPLREVLARVTGFTLRNGHLPYLGLRLRERLKLRVRPVQRRPSTPSWLTTSAHSLALAARPRDVLGQWPSPAPDHSTRPRTAARMQDGVSAYLAGIIAAEVTRERVELRCPLLDSRVIRFVVSVPPVPWCQNKFLPRQAYRAVLPLAIRRRPKRGIAGLDAALVREWLDGRAAADVTWPAPLDQWVDAERWRYAVRQPATTAEAWRALQLAAWLTGPRQSAARSARV